MGFGFNSSASSKSTTKQLAANTTHSRVSEQLTAIFKKINTENSKEAIRELFELKQQHPDLDLDKYYKNSSGKLKAYVDENLRALEQERSPPSSSSASSSSSSSSTTLTSNMKKAAIAEDLMLGNDIGGRNNRGLLYSHLFLFMILFIKFLNILFFTENLSIFDSQNSNFQDFL